MAAFLALETCLAGWLFATYPADIAGDTLWPSFMAYHYKVAYAAADQAPRFSTLNFFIGSQMTPLICGLLALGGLILFLKSRALIPDPRLLLLLLIYLWFCLTYYKQVWKFYGGSWMLCLAAAPAINLLPSRYKLLLVALLLPGFFVGLRAILPQSPRSSVQLTTLPNGEHLWLPKSVIANNNSLIQELKQIGSSDPSRTGVLFTSRRPEATVASTFYFFYQLPQPVRHSMIFPGWLRQHDYNLLPESVARSKALVIWQSPRDGKPPSDACSWEAHLYSRPYCQELTRHLGEPIKSDDSTWIFPLN